MNSDISVVIVSWNVKDRLQVCLQSVIYANPLEIIVVDNNSKDASVQMVKANFSQVSLIAFPENFGFAKACNAGIKQARGDIILLLNPDSILKIGAVVEAKNFFTNHSRAGIMGGQIINEDGSIQPSVRKDPTLWSQVAIITKIRYLFPSLVNKYLMKDFSYSKISQVEQVSGAFFFITRRFLDKVGLLDEGFFIWFEEVDWCRRARSHGFEVWYNPLVVAQHVGGASFYQLSHFKRQKMFNASLRYYFKKNHSVIAYLILVILSPLALLQSLIIDWFKIDDR